MLTTWVQIHSGTGSAVGQPYHRAVDDVVTAGSSLAALCKSKYRRQPEPAMPIKSIGALGAGLAAQLSQTVLYVRVAALSYKVK